MGEKHLIKTVKHSWRASTKIKKESKQVLNKLPRRNSGKATFFGLSILRKIDTD